MSNEPRRGEVYFARLDPTVGREIKKTRPVVIVSNDVNNKNKGTVTVLPLTSRHTENIYPFEARIPQGVAGLARLSKAKADQIRTIDKVRLQEKRGHVGELILRQIEHAIRVHLGLF